MTITASGEPVSPRVGPWPSMIGNLGPETVLRAVARPRMTITAGGEPMLTGRRPPGLIMIDSSGPAAALSADVRS